MVHGPVQPIECDPGQHGPGAPARLGVLRRERDKYTARGYVPLEIRWAHRADAGRRLRAGAVPQGHRRWLPMGTSQPVEPVRADRHRRDGASHHDHDGLHQRDGPQGRRTRVPDQRLHNAGAEDSRLGLSRSARKVHREGHLLMAEMVLLFPPLARFFIGLLLVALIVSAEALFALLIYSKYYGKE